MLIICNVEQRMVVRAHLASDVTRRSPARVARSRCVYADKATCRMQGRLYFRSFTEA